MNADSETSRERYDAYRQSEIERSYRDEAAIILPPYEKWVDTEIDNLSSEIDVLQDQLRTISWIVNKPRSLSQYVDELELFRAIITDVQAVFLTPRDPVMLARIRELEAQHTASPQSESGER